MKKELSKNTQTVLDILQDEVNGDVASALGKMASDYSMTWVDVGLDDNELFPTTGSDIKKELEDAYSIKGREYDIKNIAEGDDVVMIELVESYPDLETKEMYRTQLVLVLEMKDGKKKTGRHYLDPRLSRKHLTKEQVERVYKNNKGSKLVIK